MSANAGAITYQTRHGMPRAWRSIVAVAVVAGAAAAGVYVGRTVAPSTTVPAVAPAVQTATIPSTRPLSDATFEIGGLSLSGIVSTRPFADAGFSIPAADNPVPTTRPFSDGGFGATDHPAAWNDSPASLHARQAAR